DQRWPTSASTPEATRATPAAVAVASSAYVDTPVAATLTDQFRRPRPRGRARPADRTVSAVAMAALPVGVRNPSLKRAPGDHADTAGSPGGVSSSRRGRECDRLLLGFQTSFCP